MPFYKTIYYSPLEDQKKIARDILKLREELNIIPKRTVDSTLIVGTWNLRDFGSKKTAFGDKLPHSYFYIAEIIAQYDIIALQEVNFNLEALDRLLEILGPSWDYFASSASFLRSSNNQRFAFLYDRRKIEFKNIAGHVILDKKDLILGTDQFARPPYIVDFQANSFKFSICCVHMWYGGNDEKNMARRIAEIDTIAKLMSRKMERENSNVILLGDFNIVDPNHPTMEAITRHGFTMPEKLVLPSNTRKDKYYNQIAFKTKMNELQFGDSDPNCGIVDFFESVFTTRDFKYYNAKKELNKTWEKSPDRYKSDTKKKEFYHQQWKTYQMSDHFPLWAELKVDFSDEIVKSYLK